jgi:gluconate 2-dehydrogenase alpha chain
VRDELKFTRRHELHQNTATETYTFRNRVDETALPMRRWQFAYPANHLGGAGVHWSGRVLSLGPGGVQAAQPLHAALRRAHLREGITAQDWPLTYDELEPYYDRFDYLVGASGFAGNLKGVIQPGGKSLRALALAPLPQPADEGPAWASALRRGGGEARLSPLHTALGTFHASPT